MAARRGQGDFHHDSPPPEPLPLFNPEQGDEDHLRRLHAHDRAVEKHYEYMNDLADIYEDLAYNRFLEREEEAARPVQQPTPEVNGQSAAGGQPRVEDGRGEDQPNASGPQEM